MNNHSTNRVISSLTILLAIIFCQHSDAQSQQLSTDEISFLKSLSGRWNPAVDYSSVWGSWCMDLTIKYMNGALKISCPSFISEYEKNAKIITANYDQSANEVSFSYTCTVSDDDCDSTITVYITIPFQTDIEDSILLLRKYKFANSYSLINDGEIFYYKH